MGPFIIHKGRFLAAGTHFFHAGGVRGGARKNIFFSTFLKGVKNIGISLKPP